MDQMENTVSGEQMVTLNEARVVFLGDGEAGKSHILARLMEHGNVPDEYMDLSMHGFQIRNMTYDMGDRQIKLHFWDFGGLEILHSMHRIFMTRQTFYVVVLNARDDTQNDRARYWLNTVKSFAPGAPVLLVLNKIDQNINASVNEAGLRKEYPQLTQVVRLSALMDSREEFNRRFTEPLLEEIRKSGLPDVQWPASWLQVRERLESMPDSRVMGNAFQRICEECHIEDDREELLRQFNDLGISLSFGDEQDVALRDNVVLRPVWITNALYIILFNGCEGAQNGLIPHASIYDLLYRAYWDPDIRCVLPDVQYSVADMVYVLGIMRKFRLSFQATENAELIPSLSQQNSAVDIHNFMSDSEVLECRIEFEYLPADLLYRMMAERSYELDTDHIWRTGAQFNQPGTGLSAVVTIDENALLIFNRRTKAGHSPSAYLAELKAHVDRIVRSMDLEEYDCQLIYKLDGKREAFQYEMLLRMQENGQQYTFSKSHRRMIPIADILNQNTPNDLETECHLRDVIRKSCSRIQEFPGVNRLNEEQRTRFIRDNLEMQGYQTWDQVGGTIGGMDLVIHDGTGKLVAGVEMMNIHPEDNWIRRWDDHLSHFLDRNAMGLSPLFLLCFVTCKPDQYSGLWHRYSEHIRQYSPDRARLHSGSCEEIEESEDESRFLRITRCRYYVGGMDLTLYHYFVRVDAVEESDWGDDSDPVAVADESGAEQEHPLPEEEDGQEEATSLPAQLPEATDAGEEQPESQEHEESGTEVPEEEAPYEPAKPPARDSVLKKLWDRILETLKKLVLPAHGTGKTGHPQVLKECRVVFLGDSEAGKTLIMSRVENPKMDPARFHGNTTIGINIFSRVETIAGQLVRVNYWDFGGQEILHSMHRMFLSERTIYVIVLNTRNDNQDAQADFWLRYVEAYAPRAPVMLVMNKIDQNKRASLNLAVLRRQFKMNLDDSNVLKISAVEKDPEVFRRQFKDRLLAFIEQNSFCIHEFKSREALIRDEVERKQEKVFRFYDFLQICSSNGIEKEDDQISLMNRFNDAGILISFGTQAPMFLNPRWITSLIYRVLDQGAAIADNGVVSDIRLGTICEHNPARWKGAEDANFLIRIMQDYDLAFDCEKQGNEVQTLPDKHLIPMLCRREEPGTIQKLIRDDDPVEMRMVFEYLPGGVLYKLMAQYQQQLDKRNIWLTGAKYDHENGGYEILRQEGNTMAIYVHRNSKSAAVKRLVELSEKIEYIAGRERFNATLLETKISYRVAEIKEYFDYQQLLNTKESGVNLVTSTRREARSLTKKPPKIPVLNIFDQDEGRERRETEELLQRVLMGCMDVQRDRIFWKADENARNRQLARALRGPFITKDQTQGGTSGSGKSDGELDIEILNEAGMPVAILEALKGTSIGTGYWMSHLNKLVENYNTSGLPSLILTTYVEGRKKNFETKFGDTARQWTQFEPKGFEGCRKSVEEIMRDVRPELIHITRTVYVRNQFRVSVYHFMVHIGEDKAEPASDGADQQ